MKKILIVLTLLYKNIIHAQPPINYQNLYQEIVKNDIKFPEVVFAQAVLETGHFTSKLFQQANNLFGMKIPSKRETLAVGKRKGNYAVFHDWLSSVSDYQIWQQYILKNKNIKTKKEYLALLNRIYAENQNYVQLLHKVMEKHKDIFN